MAGHLKVPSIILTVLCLTVPIFAVRASSSPCPHGCRCDRLHTVDCSGLGLTELPSASSTTWPRDATRLLLQKNRLRALPANAFLSRGLGNLSVVDLSDNLLDDIEPRAFNGLQKLELLDLQRNQLRAIEGQAFFGVSGKGGHSRYGERCRVDLRHNNLQVIKENAFAWVKDLALVFGENPTEKMTIKQYAFYGMRNIPDITIKGVGELTITPRAFTNFERLGRIDVRDTVITYINNYTFEGLTELGGLNLVNCTISRMDPYAFAGIKYTKNATVPAHGVTGAGAPGGYFYLSKSDFPVLPQDAFRDTNLASVTLTDNSMRQIDPYAFRDMDSLKLIHIRNNSLERLSTNSFAAIANLEELILHGNKISSIEPYAFREAGFIKTLSIGQSRDVKLTLQPNALSQLFEVTNLEIANLSSLEIMPNAFKDLTKVKRLKIESVSLPTLQKDAFNGLRLVGSFHIAFCNVTTIQPGVFGKESQSRSAIDSFDLSQGNRIQCGCDIRRVLSEFQSTFSSYNSVQCVRVSESGALVPVSVHQIPLCAGCTVSTNVILLTIMLVVLLLT